MGDKFDWTPAIIFAVLAGIFMLFVIQTLFQTWLRLRRNLRLGGSFLHVADNDLLPQEPQYDTQRADVRLMPIGASLEPDT